jgi:hypothetical protein
MRRSENKTGLIKAAMHLVLTRWQLYTGLPPFSELSETAAMLRVINGQRPAKPSGDPLMSEALWGHVLEYWAETPASRPTIDVAVHQCTLYQQRPALPSPEYPLEPQRRNAWLNISSGSMSDEEMMHELRRIVCTDNAGTVYSKIEKIGQGCVIFLVR